MTIVIIHLKRIQIALLSTHTTRLHSATSEHIYLTASPVNNILGDGKYD